MAKIRIADLYPFDGEYEIDPSRFNGTELHLIKQISGVRGGELGEAARAGDYDLVVAFTVIALRRAGKQVEPEQIMDAEIGRITLDLSETKEVEEERPPDSLSPSGKPNEPGDNNEPHEPTEVSGSGSHSIGDSPPSRPSLTGLPGSATSAASDQETLAS